MQPDYQDRRRPTDASTAQHHNHSDQTMTRWFTKSLGLYMTEENYHYLSAYDGEQGLRFAPDQKPIPVILPL